MEMTIAIIAIFGVLLMILETFVPGGIVGAFGALCILTAVVLVFTVDDFAEWPRLGRAGLAAGILVGSGTIVFLWLHYFGLKIWRSAFTLRTSIASAPAPQTLAPGVEGVALSELRPMGRADFSGERCEVRCEDGFAPVGSRLTVTGSEPGNLIVRRVS